MHFSLIRTSSRFLYSFSEPKNCVQKSCTLSIGKSLKGPGVSLRTKTTHPCELPAGSPFKLKGPMIFRVCECTKETYKTSHEIYTAWLFKMGSLYFHVFCYNPHIYLGRMYSFCRESTSIIPPLQFCTHRDSM